ncbi:glyoxalase [Streptomyces sp. Act143]|uniref:VOC family protein n=1 Tax=Streptomyces sp. Act143 TaxID=2200760 RepID=UPI000D67F71A|nr:VOC family protein [Streptomyces sp. Act143]PWI15336.1 glyoxalase [Streptomyces sp. Act143]
MSQRSHVQPRERQTVMAVERLEVVTIPVSDVERAKEFYARIGWRLDRTPPTKVQFTPPGSACSVQFGTGLTTAVPGSAQNMYLCVHDIVATRDRLTALGVEVGDYYHTGGPAPHPGLHPERESYRSHFPFKDPDGNTWLVQEVTTRLPGRVDAPTAAFTSTDALAQALQRAAAAHTEYLERTGEDDEKWAQWYAEYLMNEQ